MALRTKVLCTKAKKFEQKEVDNNKIDPQAIPVIDEMLQNVYSVCRPKTNDYDVRRDLVRVFNEIAKELYGNSKEVPTVVEFGSFTMDLFNAKSDLDLSVNFGNGADEVSRDKKIQTLRKFARKFYALQSSGHVSGVLPITTAKVPILKVVDCGTGVECDISIENRDGILKSQIVNMISSIDERFRKLSFLMKAWAKAHNINSSKDKTLNSLSIVLLVAFHLQTRNPCILPPFSMLLKDGSDPTSVRRTCGHFLNYGRSNRESLAELFISLLIKLSGVEKLWAKGLCASVYEGCWLSKTWDTKIGCMSVEDFTDRSQNVARAVGASQVKSIYKCVQLSLHHFRAFMDGRMEGSMLMELLFGSNAMPPLMSSGRRAMPLMNYARTGPPVPSNNTILTKRSQPESWGGTPAESWTSTITEDRVQPHSTKRMRPGRNQEKPELSRQGWPGPLVEQWAETQQPVASSSLRGWMGESAPMGAWRQEHDWQTIRNGNAFAPPLTTKNPMFVPRLQNQFPMNIPSVHPADRHPHWNFPRKNHQIPAARRR